VLRTPARDVAPSALRLPPRLRRFGSSGGHAPSTPGPVAPSALQASHPFGMGWKCLGNNMTRHCHPTDRFYETLLFFIRWSNSPFPPRE